MEKFRAEHIIFDLEGQEPLVYKYSCVGEQESPITS